MAKNKPVGNLTQPGLQPQARPIDAFAGGGTQQAGTGAGQLAEALGVASEIVEQKRQEKEKEDLEKIDFYVNEFKKDAELGLASKTQVGEIFPDLSPRVRARVAEGLGAQYAEKYFDEQIQKALSDENIKFNSGARSVFFNDLRQDISQQVEGREFFAQGALSTIEGQIRQYNLQFRSEQAKRDIQIQNDDFRRKVSLVIRGNLTSAQPTSLKAIDDTWAKSSSLDTISRRDGIVETVLDVAERIADETGDITQAVKVLEMIPKGNYLTPDLKQQVADKKVSIRQSLLARKSAEFQARERERTLRIRQEQQDLYNKKEKNRNQRINYLDYDPANKNLVDFLNTEDPDEVDAQTSLINSTRLETQIVGSTITGDIPPSQILEQIKDAEDINKPEKIALMKKVESLANGAKNLKNNPEYDRYFNVVTNSHVAPFTASPLYELLQQRVDLQSWAQQYYDDAVDELLLFVYENNGKDFNNVSPKTLREQVYQKASIATKQALEKDFGFVKTLDNRSADQRNVSTFDIPAPDFEIPTL